ncbi:hypothetical protein MHU86_11037 [Fragilaria crotonensis]|nr:hypothetical protein MHU86_11037 [Fragilaria crotonensis]
MGLQEVDCFQIMEIVVGMDNGKLTVCSSQHWSRWSLSAISPLLMKNLGQSPDRTMQVHPYRVVVALSSSTKRDRANVTFEEQIESLTALGDRVDIHAVNMTNLTLEEQIELTSTAAVYVSVVGGGTSAMFLPKGALVSVLLPHQVPGLGLMEQFSAHQGTLDTAVA